MTTMMSWKRDPLDEQLQTLSNPGFRSAQVNGIETCSPNILISSTCKLLTILCIWVCMSSRASSLCSVLMCHSRRWVRSSMRKTSVVTLETYSRPFAPAFSALADAEGPLWKHHKKKTRGCLVLVVELDVHGELVAPINVFPELLWSCHCVHNYRCVRWIRGSVRFTVVGCCPWDVPCSSACSSLPKHLVVATLLH